MPVAQWPLRDGRPVIEVETALSHGGPPVVHCLLADTGAGSQQSNFELILDEATWGQALARKVAENGPSCRFVTLFGAVGRFSRRTIGAV